MVLWRASLRYQWRHPWQFGLSVLGVAIGVAVVLAIDLSNHSATRAFRLSTESVAGKATHQIAGGPLGVPEAVYRDLRIGAGFRQCAPIIEAQVALPALPGRVFRLLAVDPFAETPFRPFWGEENAILSGDVTPFVAVENAAIMSEFAAREMGAEVGKIFEITFAGKTRTLRLVGTLRTGSERSASLFQDLILTDISTGQQILGRAGFLDRIDLIVTDGDEGSRQMAAVERYLPPGVMIGRTQARTERMEQMTEAFSRNLLALSLLALIVGMFLIYNSITFSVVQRRSLLGALRALGVTGKEIFALVLVEALFIGMLGTLFGILAGLLLAKGLIGLVTQTINDLYFVLTVRELAITPLFFLKGVLLGTGVSVFSALLPAREATRTPARFVMNRSALESRLLTRLPLFTLGGFACLFLGALILMIPSKSLLLSFAGLLPLICGFALLTPGVIVFFVKASTPLMQGLFGTLGKMSVRAIVAEISRSAIAVAALAIAVGTTVGVGTMVDSFRATVVNWLNTTLDADIYLSPPRTVSGQHGGEIDSVLVAKIVDLAAVEEFNIIVNAQVRGDRGPVQVVGLRMPQLSRKRFNFKEGTPAKIWPKFEGGEGIVISEPYAYRHNLHAGDSLQLTTGAGPEKLSILGVYLDYASDRGLIVMARSLYRVLWEDDRIFGLSLYLKSGADEQRIMQQVRALAAENGSALLIRSNSKLRQMSIEIFDRTFAITNVLRVLTIVVAFIGVLSALMALQLERSRELGVLRANGLTPRQLWGLVTLQTGSMGGLAGIIALPFGLTLAYILIFVINKRSFGWTLHLQLSPEIFVQALLLAIVAALLAGIYPAFKMAGTPPALALREE